MPRCFGCKETTLDTLNEAKVCDSMFGDLFNKRLIKIQPLQFLIKIGIMKMQQKPR